LVFSPVNFGFEDNRRTLSDTKIFVRVQKIERLKNDLAMNLLEQIADLEGA